MWGSEDAIDDRGTPADLFAELDARFHFTIDVAASASNHKVARWYGLQQDGLAHSWAAERVWCNPPYSRIPAWVRKARVEFEAACPLIVMLLPASRTEQAWWQDDIEPFRDRGLGVRTEFLRGRRSFALPGLQSALPNSRVPFGLVLAIWEPVGG
jgi:phage N-6-adenine-methyltransferase